MTMQQLDQSSPSTVEDQIYKKRKDVKYDIRDLTVEVIVSKYLASIEEEDISLAIKEDPKKYNCIYVPEYQRDFTWDDKRQSKFIESIILGLPIPFIFVAENKDSSWEIVDGSQRVRTLHNFIENNLILSGLKSLDKLNDYKFELLDKSRKGKLLSTALRMIVLSEETTDDVKKDMFERINLGSDILKPMEKRKGIYKGLFLDFIYGYCSSNEKFINLVQLDKWLSKRQEREELLLRFFAFSENNIYEKGINDGVANYLDCFVERKNEELGKLSEPERIKEIERLNNKINKVVSFVESSFPFGFRHTHNPQTKRSVFEAISIGVLVYLESDTNSSKKIFNKNLIEEELKSPEFKKFTHVANELHKKQKLSGRVNYIRSMLHKLGDA